MSEMKSCPLNWFGGPKSECDGHSCQYWDISKNRCSQSEEWRDVEGYPNELQISSEGRVRVLEERLDVTTMAPIKVCRILRPVEMNQDYLGVHYDGKGFFVHVLLAKAFVPNPENKRLVVHKNRKKHENFADNIEWQTNSEIAKESIASGIMSKPPGYQGYIIECTSTGEIFYGLKATADKLNVTVRALESAMNKKQPLNGKFYELHQNYRLQRKKNPHLFKNSE